MLLWTSCLHSFLELTSHYSAVLKLMYRLQFLINHLIVKDIPLNWTRKSTLNSKSLLTYHDQFFKIISDDSSTFGFGAVILHVFQNAVEKEITHPSRTSTLIKRNADKYKRCQLFHSLQPSIFTDFYIVKDLPH